MSLLKLFIISSCSTTARFFFNALRTCCWLPRTCHRLKVTPYTHACHCKFEPPMWFTVSIILFQSQVAGKDNGDWHIYFLSLHKNKEDLIVCHWSKHCILTIQQRFIPGGTILPTHVHLAQCLWTGCWPWPHNKMTNTKSAGSKL
jgi:hypothetical protein